MNLGRAYWFRVQRSMHQRYGIRLSQCVLAVHTCAAALAIGFSLMLTGAANARAGERVALVMAVEDYQKLPKSSVGVKRGSEIADALQARGFDVIVTTNPNNAAARASLREFAAKAEAADIAFVVLIGHGIAWSGQSFFLTTNTEIGRATDLLSRALSVTNIAQIVGRARTGAVFFLMTTPSFGAPIDGLDPRPQFAGEIGKNVVAVFSSSARVPVSRVDAVSEQAADALAKLLRQSAPSLRDVVKTASNGEMGAIMGTAADLNLAKPPPVATAEPAATTTARAPEPDKKGEMEGRLEAERQARELAERRARAEQLKTEQAQADVIKAQADARKAQADAERAQAEARKAQADAEKAQADAERVKLEAKRIEAQAQIAKAQTEIVTPANMAAPIDEAQLGRRQRERIQERLREMGLYTGPIDSIMGPLTREGIMGFQKSRGAAVTGYLTPDQFEALLSKGQ